MIQGGDSAAKQGPTRTTYLEGKARKEQAAHKRKAEEELNKSTQTQTKTKQDPILIFKQPKGNGCSLRGGADPRQRDGIGTSLSESTSTAKEARV